ncbi:YlbF family regulator [Paradesulfitobacterium ferrireducens]|uniref:YlbF family regulator n=1 Tax=Paradesulfitobacterium ferrireducens TaxID=2816476 RepID=UPI001A8EDC8D|nr:YlbF family regulator [Paradesulfitobacterium ferrireducens]
MNYIDKARELGELLAQTPEVQGLKSAEAAINADPPSSEAFKQYQEKERQLVAAQMLSKVVPEKDALALVDLKIRLINKHPLIKAFFLQQQKYEKMMAMVNLALTTAIHGMPSADQLPLPDELKNMAQQILNGISNGSQMPSMQVPPDFKMPQGMKLPPNFKMPGQ